MNYPDVLSLIPQRTPFVMVDEIVSVNQQETTTKFTVRAGHLFVENNFFTEPGLIENMAQTAAAGMGFNAQKQLETSENAAPQIGFIGALKNLQIHALPKVGDTIFTTITVLHEVMNARIAQGIVLLHEKEIARCEFKIFLQQQG